MYECVRRRYFNCSNLTYALSRARQIETEFNRADGVTAANQHRRHKQVDLISIG